MKNFKRTIAGFLAALMIFSTVTGDLSYVSAADNADDEYLTEQTVTEESYDGEAEEAVVEETTEEDAVVEEAIVEEAIVEETAGEDTVVEETAEEETVVEDPDADADMEASDSEIISEEALNEGEGGEPEPAARIFEYVCRRGLENVKAIEFSYFYDWQEDNTATSFYIKVENPEFYVEAANADSDYKWSWEDIGDNGYGYSFEIPEDAFNFDVALELEDGYTVDKGPRLYLEADGDQVSDDLGDSVIKSMKPEDLESITPSCNISGKNIRFAFDVIKAEDGSEGTGMEATFDIVCQSGFEYITSIEYYINGDNEKITKVTSESDGWDDNWVRSYDEEHKPAEWENWRYSISLDEDATSVSVRVNYDTEKARLDDYCWIVLRADGNIEGNYESFDDFVEFYSGDKANPSIEFGLVPYPDRSFDFSVWNAEGTDCIESIQYSIDGGETYTTIDMDEFEQRFPDEYDSESGEEPEWTNWGYQLYNPEAERTVEMQAFIDALNSAESITVVIVPKNGFELDAFDGNRIEGWDDKGNNKEWSLSGNDGAVNAEESDGSYKYTFTFEDGYYFYDFGFLVSEIRDRFEVNVWNGWEDHIDYIEYKIDGEEDFKSIRGNVRTREFDDEETGERREETVYYIPCDDASSVTVKARLLDGMYINERGFWGSGKTFDKDEIDEIIEELLSDEGFTYTFAEEDGNVNLGFSVEEKRPAFSLIIGCGFNHIESVKVGFSAENLEKVDLTKYFVEEVIYNQEDHSKVDEVQYRCSYPFDNEQSKDKIWVQIVPKEGFSIEFVEKITDDDYYVLNWDEMLALSGQTEQTCYEITSDPAVSNDYPLDLHVRVNATSRYRFVDANGKVLNPNNSSDYDIGNLVSFTGTQKYYLQKVDESADTLTYKNVPDGNQDIELSVYTSVEGEEGEEFEEINISNKPEATIGSDKNGRYVQFNWAKSDIFANENSYIGQIYADIRITDKSESWENEDGEIEYRLDGVPCHFVNTDFCIGYYDEVTKLPNNTEVKVDACEYYSISNGVFDYQYWNGNPENKIIDVNITNSTPNIADVICEQGEDGYFPTINLVPKKAGLATFTIKYKFNGVQYSYTVKARVDIITYTIAFDSNAPEKKDGTKYVVTGAMTNQVVKYGDDAVLKANAFKITGYEFVGWSEDPEYDKDEEGILYADLDTVCNLTSENKGVVTLYAIWSPIEYKITYHTGGGELSGKIKYEYTVNDAEYIIPTLEEISGYEFAGWYAENTYKTKVTSIDTSKAKDVDVWAKLVPVSITVKFVNDEFAPVATGSMSDQKFQYNIPQAIKANAYVAKGYKFVGWAEEGVFYENIHGNAVLPAWVDEDEAEDKPSVGLCIDEGWIIPDKDKHVFTEDTVLVAIWMNTYSITLDCAYGEISDEYLTEERIIELKVGENAAGKLYQAGSYPLFEGYYSYSNLAYSTLPVPVYTGHTFAGWYAENGKKYTNIPAKSAVDLNLTARWTPYTYTIKFNANGGSGKMAGMNVTDRNESYDLNANKFTRPGYTFAGWSLEPDGLVVIDDKETIIASGCGLFVGEAAEESTVTFAKNNDSVTLYAVWSQDPAYTVTLHIDRGGCNPEFLFLEDCDADDIFAENNLGIEKVDNNYIFEYSYDGTADCYYGEEPLPATKNAAIVLPKFKLKERNDDIVPAGFKFIGWYSDEQCTQKVANISKGKTGNIDLYAKWDYSYKLSIKFDKNLPKGVDESELSGTVQDKAGTASSIVYGTNFTLPNCTYKLNDYVFLGWSIKNDYEVANFDIYANGGKFKINSEFTQDIFECATLDVDNASVVLTLYAVWSNEGIVCFNYGNADGVTYYGADVPDGYAELETVGSLNSLETRYTYGKQYALPVVDMIGYDFKGWYKDKAFKKPYASIPTTARGNITLYAKLVPKTYIIEFVENKPDDVPEDVNVTGTMKDLSMSYDTSKALTLNTYKLPGYVFMGWTVNGRVFKNGQKVSNADLGYYYNEGETVVTLCAVWSNKGNVTFDPDGGDIDLEQYKSVGAGNKLDIDEELETSYEFGTVYVLPTPVKDGYTFAGWYDTVTNKKIEKITKTTVGDLELKATWTGKTYKVVFNPNLPEGVTANPGKMSNATFVFGTTKALPKNAFKVPGYEFGGWASDPYEEGVYENKADFGMYVEEFPLDGKVQLYAIWDTVDYTITLKNLSGALYDDMDWGDSAEAWYTVENNLGDEIKEPTKIGYTFMGWYTDAKFTKKYTFKTRTTGNITLYAKWSVNK